MICDFTPPGPLDGVIRRPSICSVIVFAFSYVNQLPFVGVYAKSTLSSNVRAFSASKVLYGDAPVCVLRLSITSVIRCASG